MALPVLFQTGISPFRCPSHLMASSSPSGREVKSKASASSQRVFRMFS